MQKFRISVGVTESILTKHYFEIEADDLEEAENLAITLSGECKEVGKEFISSEITDVELTGDFEVLELE